MLTLQKILSATPMAIRMRAKDQCFGQAYKPPRKATNVTKSGGYLIEDESGQYREFRYKTKCTDGWRKVVVRFYGPINVNTPVWCACSCPYFKYHCEVALAKRGSSAVIQSDGQRPRFTNPRLEPRVCVIGNTLIDTETGLRRASEIKVGDSLVTMENSLSKVIEVFKSTRKVRRVLLHSGRNLICTDDHPILTLDKETFTLGWKNAMDLDDGDVVAIKHGTHQWPTELLFDDYRTPERIALAARLPLKAPAKMSNELARLLGYLVSEGSRGYFSNTEKKMAEDFIHCSKVVFDYEPELEEEVLPSGKTLYKVAIRSTVFSDFMRYVGYDASTAYQKVMPWPILQGSKDHALHYLSAFIDGDGSVDDEGSVIRAGTVSKRLMKDTQTLLSRLGVDGSLWQNRVKKNFHGRLLKKPKITWFVSVSGPSAARLAELLPPLCSPQKVRALEKARSTVRGTADDDILPGLNKVLTAKLDQERARRKTTETVIVDSDMTSSELAALMGKGGHPRGGEYAARLMASVGISPSGSKRLRKSGKPHTVFSKEDINKAMSLLDFCEHCQTWVTKLTWHENVKHGGSRAVPTVSRRASRKIREGSEVHYSHVSPEVLDLLTKEQKEVISMGLQFEQVVNNESLRKKKTVYDFKVEAGHFKANSIIVHNCKHVFLVFMLALRRRLPDQDVLKPTNSLIGRVAKRVGPRDVWLGEGNL